MHNTPFSIFVCEFITAGGLNHQDLPESLMREGLLMRDALLCDLADLPYVLSTTCDARVPRPLGCERADEVAANQDVWALWHEQIARADAVWLIAPESDGVLLRLTQMVEQSSALLLGCNAAAVAITASKRATYQCLMAHGITSIPTFSAATLRHLPETGAWIVKPDDGVGCAETRHFASMDAVQRYLQQSLNKNEVVQPYQAGIPASISCVVRQGEAMLLSGNLQYIDEENSLLHYQGSLVNGMRQYQQTFAKVAQQVATAIPGLAGYVGIDVIVQAEEVIVVEVNPRLTTSYAGLRQAIGVNPAQLIMQSFTESWVMPPLQQQVVEVRVS